jgi:ABC-2 type transport system permease protein
MPMDIYPRWIQQLGIFVLPIFMISNFPSMFLLNRMSPVYLAWAAMLPVILLVIVRSVWRLGLKNYNSASS